MPSVRNPHLRWSSLFSLVCVLLTLLVVVPSLSAGAVIRAGRVSRPVIRRPRANTCAALTDDASFRGKPIFIGAPPGSPFAFRVGSAADAARVLDGSLSLGDCTPLDELIAQLLVAKFNQGTGAKGNAANTVAAAMAAADKFLGDYNWRDENALPPFPPGSLCDILDWTRQLKSFNIAASPAGQLSAASIAETERKFPGAAKRLDRWKSTTGSCGYTLPESTCAAKTQDDVAEFQCIPVVQVPAADLSLLGKMKRLSIKLSSRRRGQLKLMSAYTPYINIRNSPTLDWSIQGYTARDWERWDSYDYRSQFIDTTGFGPSLGTIPAVTDINTQLNARVTSGPSATPTAISHSAPTANFARDWQLEMSGSALRKVFFPSAYKTFRDWYHPTSNYQIMDMLYLAGGQYYMDSRLVFHNVSFSVNQMYNMWRKEKKTEIRDAHKLARPTASTSTINTLTNRDFDALPILDPRNEIPGMIGVAAWLEDYIARHLSFQQTTQLMLPGRRHPDRLFNALGLFRLADPTLAANSSLQFDFEGQHWSSGTIGFTYGHFMHLLNDHTVRALRNMSMYCLSGLYNENAIADQFGDIDQFSQAQWLLRMTGFSVHAWNIIHSESLLRQRGSWIPADEVASTDIQNGRWTRLDAINLSDDRLKVVYDRTTQYGMLEFLSSYHGHVMQLLELGMMHAPSQTSFFYMNEMYKLWWADLALNYHPGSNTFSGPSGRLYDLWNGCRNVADRFDLPMRIQWSQKPYCSQAVAQYAGWADGTLLSNAGVSSLCHSNSLTTIPSGGNLAEIVQRLFGAAWHAAGRFYAPLDLMFNVIQSSPYRTIEQRYSAAQLQERYNFITPSLQMGFAGESRWGMPVGNFITARLSGRVLANSPPNMDNNGQAFAVPYVRMMCETRDTPFSNAFNPTVAGDNQAVMARLVASQWQAFMVLTTFFTPQSWMSEADSRAPWNTNIMLPLWVDGLYADNFQLPTAIGTAYAIPHNAIITVRHLGQSIAIRMIRGEYLAGPPTITVSTTVTTTTSVFNATTNTTHTVTTTNTTSQLMPNPDHIKQLPNGATPLLVPFADSDAPYTLVPNGTSYLPFYPGTGRQPYSLMWLVEPSSSSTGSGRLVLHHKHTGVASWNSYRGAWTWMAGLTNTNARRNRLLNTIRQAVVTETFVNTPAWDVQNQKVDDAYCPGCPRAASQWSLSVAAAGSVTVALSRADVYQPWRNHQIYQLPATGSPFTPPYFIDNISRTVNGRQILTWAAGEKPFRYVRHTAAQIWQPWV